MLEKAACRGGFFGMQEAKILSCFFGRIAHTEITESTERNFVLADL